MSTAQWSKLKVGMSADEVLKIAPEVGREDVLTDGTRCLKYAGAGGEFTVVIQHGRVIFLEAPGKEVGKK